MAAKRKTVQDYVAERCNRDRNGETDIVEVRAIQVLHTDLDRT